MPASARILGERERALRASEIESQSSAKKKERAAAAAAYYVADGRGAPQVLHIYIERERLGQSVVVVVNLRPVLT